MNRLGAARRGRLVIVLAGAAVLVSALVAALLNGPLAGRASEPAPSAHAAPSPTASARPTPRATPSPAPTPGRSAAPTAPPRSEPAPGTPSADAPVVAPPPAAGRPAAKPPAAAPAREPGITEFGWVGGDSVPCPDLTSSHIVVKDFAWKARDTKSVDILVAMTDTDQQAVSGFTTAGSGLSPTGVLGVRIDCGSSGLPRYVTVKVVARNTLASSVAHYWGVPTGS